MPLKLLSCGANAISSLSPAISGISPLDHHTQSLGPFGVSIISFKWSFVEPISFFCLSVKFLIAKVGLGFEAPKGSSLLISSTSETSMSSISSSKSISKEGFSFCPFSISSTVWFKAFLTVSRVVFGSLKEKPPASWCPPYPSRSSEIVDIISYKLSSFTPRAEQRYRFVSS